MYGVRPGESCMAKPEATSRNPLRTSTQNLRRQLVDNVPNRRHVSEEEKKRRSASGDDRSELWGPCIHRIKLFGTTFR